jgi:hypothetical protein
VVEFYRRASGGFKSGGRWDGQTKLLPLAQVKSFDLYTSEEITLAVGDTVRLRRISELGRTSSETTNCARKVIDGEKSILNDHRIITVRRPLHVDQGPAVTSHAAQGKTVDQVILSLPVPAFSQTNQAQFYVSMSRAGASTHLFTDSKVALKEAVARPSERLSL